VTEPLGVEWIHGAVGEPAIQAHWYDEATVILRQAKSLNYEAPFLFLLFGEERALLLDTGAVSDPRRFPLRETIDILVAHWLDQHPKPRYALVVAHSHGHGDHVAADGQFADRPDTVVVGLELEGVQSFFGFNEWPAQVVEFDLGRRRLEIIGSPGHHRAAITIYDPRTGFMLTGDTVLPGRLYVENHAEFLSTMDRLVAFAADRRVTHVLGCHVEMTKRPGRDYPRGAMYQPHERALELSAQHLTAVRDAAKVATPRRRVVRFADFILYIEPGRREVRALRARGLANRLLARLVRPRRHPVATPTG
jgi:glyoxylase-like metal-dependent hydrolase (beta-lactamase superfamily II)